LDDPCKILGVPRDAIRQTYRDLAKQNHPDLNPGNAKAQERFKAVSSANDILSDPAKRSQFDRGEIDAAGQEQARHPSYSEYAKAESGRNYTRSEGQAGGWSQDDLDGSMFGQSRGPGGGGPRKGQDERYALTAEFNDAVKKLGLYGFGAAGHIVAQFAKWQGREVFAFTRPGDVATQAFARSLGGGLGRRFRRNAAMKSKTKSPADRRQRDV
jgi:curved DNA-binding protein CbpA